LFFQLPKGDLRNGKHESSASPQLPWAGSAPARAGVFVHPCAVFNYLDTMIAMVEAGEGVAITPSFVLPTRLRSQAKQNLGISP
jgi:DNA-binding transcriptional LysR family regulator